MILFSAIALAAGALASWEEEGIHSDTFCHSRVHLDFVVVVVVVVVASLTVM